MQLATVTNKIHSSGVSSWFRTYCCVCHFHNHPVSLVPVLDPCSYKSQDWWCLLLMLSLGLFNVLILTTHYQRSVTEILLSCFQMLRACCFLLLDLYRTALSLMPLNFTPLLILLSWSSFSFKRRPVLLCMDCISSAVLTAGYAIQRGFSWNRAGEL